MIAKRAFGGLALTVALSGVATQPALAQLRPRAAASAAVSAIMRAYQWSGNADGLFTSNCRDTSHGRNCWWWAANTLMALITYAEDNPSTAAAADIKRAVGNTYHAICRQGACPSSANQAGSDPFANTYYDDTGWWEQAWINAYKYTHVRDYLYLAEQLWSYVTKRGWFTACGGGVVQHNSGGSQDAYANALYLRNSAWLYSITGLGQYMTGAGGRGGALADAAFITKHLIRRYNSIAPGTQGSTFMIADHLNASCGPAGSQMWLASQGEMVNAFSDMYAADKAYGGSDPGYYNQLADELALSTIHDTKPYPGQAEPTVDRRGILSEPCEPRNRSAWPRGCEVGSAPINSYKPFLIFKGIFERGIYCSDHNYRDPVLESFIAKNAASIAAIGNFGFLWDSTAANLPRIFSTQASALDGLDAHAGRSYAMC